MTVERRGTVALRFGFRTTTRSGRILGAAAAAPPPPPPPLCRRRPPGGGGGELGPRDRRRRMKFAKRRERIFLDKERREGRGGGPKYRRHTIWQVQRDAESRGSLRCSGGHLSRYLTNSRKQSGRYARARRGAGCMKSFRSAVGGREGGVPTPRATPLVRSPVRCPGNPPFFGTEITCQGEAVEVGCWWKVGEGCGL